MIETVNAHAPNFKTYLDSVKHLTPGISIVRRDSLLGQSILAAKPEQRAKLEKSYGQIIDNFNDNGVPVIITTGAQARWLGLPSEEKFKGFGVSACATCDGFFFRDQELVVVGGGDTAMEEANFLTRFATKVTVIHRRDALRASKIMQDRAFKNPKIDFIWNAVVEDIHGSKEEGVKAVTLKDTQSGQTREFPTQGVFVAIGHQPNTGIFKGQIDLHDNGYIKVKPGTTTTSVPGSKPSGRVASPVLSPTSIPPVRPTYSISGRVGTSERRRHRDRQ